MHRLLFWLRAARAPFFTGALAPILVGTALAFYTQGSLHWDLAGLALLALILLHASANLSNDYFDHLTGNDELNKTFASPFTGGSRVIQEGLVQPKTMLAASLLCMALAALIGFYLVYRAGLPILWLGVIGGVTGFLYTAPPFRLAYRGGGELFIFLNFGILPVMGAYYLQTHTFNALGFWGGAIVGLLITDILWINQFQDREADAAAGKRNWVVRLGRRRSVPVHLAFLALPYVIVAAGVIQGWLPAWALLVLLSLPLAAKAAITAAQHYDDLPQLTPANAATIGTHLVLSVLLSIGLFIAGGPPH
jgi:1,4-dihydroxy-2-naphthoate octaprenyltransferase